MFSGIVQGTFSVETVIEKRGLTAFSVTLSDELLDGLKMGASVSVDGVCLTVVKIVDKQVFFDVIEETLKRTTLNTLQSGRRVNIERSLRFGEEVGGHLMSGHVFGTAKISQIDQKDENYILHFQCPAEWMRYLFPKGYIALDGCSLTLVDVDPKGSFTVHLIPETLRQTVFATKKVGDRVNLEFDAHTQAIVDTVSRAH